MNCTILNYCYATYAFLTSVNKATVVSLLMERMGIASHVEQMKVESLSLNAVDTVAQLQSAYV